MNQQELNQQESDQQELDLDELSQQELDQQDLIPQDFNRKDLKELDTTELVKKIIKLDPVEFLGIIKFFNISITNEKGEPRDFYELLSEFLDIYVKLNRTQKRNFSFLVKEATKETKKKKMRRRR